MDMISKQDLTHLLEGRGDTPHVSIFLPTMRAGVETQQNTIRFKNLLREASQRLADGGMDKTEVDQLLAPARALVDDFDFWQHQADGLAVFVADDFFETYRVPIEFTELVTVEDHFHVKSLFPLFNIEGEFYVLALSQNEVRLLRGDRYRVHEIQLEDVPKSLADALGHETTEPQIQAHTGSRTARMDRSPIFHGQGAGEEDQKAEIRKFFNILDRGIQDFLGDKRSPLVLAGVDFLLPLYREVSDYQHIVETGVKGNPEELSAEELHDRAWDVVVEVFRAQRREVVERYNDLKGNDKASGKIDEVVPAAVDGRVDTLFVPRGVRRWGTFDSEQRILDQHDEQQPDSEDLLDLAAIHTFLNSGQVYAVAPEDMPDGGHVAAVFRY